MFWCFFIALDVTNGDLIWLYCKFCKRVVFATSKWNWCLFLLPSNQSFTIYDISIVFDTSIWKMFCSIRFYWLRKVCQHSHRNLNLFKFLFFQRFLSCFCLSKPHKFRFIHKMFCEECSSWFISGNDNSQKQIHKTTFWFVRFRQILCYYASSLTLRQTNDWKQFCRRPQHKQFIKTRDWN